MCVLNSKPPAPYAGMILPAKFNFVINFYSLALIIVAFSPPTGARCSNFPVAGLHPTGARCSDFPVAGLRPRYNAAKITVLSEMPPGSQVSDRPTAEPKYLVCV